MTQQVHSRIKPVRFEKFLKNFNLYKLRNDPVLVIKFLCNKLFRHSGQTRKVNFSENETDAYLPLNMLMIIFQTMLQVYTMY